MKEIKAVIQEFILPKVMDALRMHPEFPGLTISRVQALEGAKRVRILPKHGQK